MNPLFERVIDVTARRCWVPDDFDEVTDLGDEQGSEEIAEKVWALVEDLYSSGMHPAIQVCIRHEGNVVVDRSIGYARGNLPGRAIDPDHLVPMSVDTPVNLFSAAKAVTAMVIHKLVEMGAFGLDDPIADHIPGFGRHGKGDITVRHVLGHTAGIATLPEEAFDLDLLTDHSKIEEIVCDLRPSADAGASTGYHAVTGGLVLEAVTQRATGRSLRDVLADEIKDPLGLDWLDFGVAPEDTHLVAQNVETGLPLGPAIGFFMKRTLGKAWGPVLRMSNDPRFLSAVIPSGNVIVTARDVATFYQCLLNGGSIDGTRVFDETTVANAIRAERDGLEIVRFLTLPMRYSPGFMLGSDSVSLYGWNHPRIFGHVGMSNLFTWADPDRDLVVALLTTGKPVIGSHLGALVRLISGIHETFPERERV